MEVSTLNLIPLNLFKVSPLIFNKDIKEQYIFWEERCTQLWHTGHRVKHKSMI